MRSEVKYLLFAAQVIERYEKVGKKALEILPDLVCCSQRTLEILKKWHLCCVLQ